MNGEGVRKLRDRLGLSQAELAVLLNEPLGRAYRSSSVSAWETDKRPVPADVARMLDALAIEGPPEAPPLGTVTEPPPSGEDDAPPPPSPGEGVNAQVPLHPSGGHYARACQELWEMIGLSLGMIGAAIGSQKLQQDGIIIDADKVALGRAWGKLAETNETFRNMLMSMTTGGAWLEVALVTGTTVGKVVRNHSVLDGTATVAGADGLRVVHSGGTDAAEPAAAS